MQENTSYCDHCGIPVGPWPHVGEVAGTCGQFCCYGCFIASQAEHGGGDDVNATAFLIRLGIGGFLGMNIMLFSLLLYSDVGHQLDTDFKIYIHFLLLVLATPVLVLLGAPFFLETLRELGKFRLSPSVLIVLGSGSAYIHSVLITIKGGDKVYFDTVTMVLVLFTLGRYLEASMRARATRSLRPMMEAENQKVIIIEDGHEKIISLAEAEPGMLVRVRSGERILVDGIVEEGQSRADEALLTGEPLAVTKSAGDAVYASSLNGDGSLVIKVTALGLQSRWLEICKDVRRSLGQPTEIQRLAERAALLFVPVVILISAFAIWLNWQPGLPELAVMAGLSVLVVACPCALGLSAPLATSLAITKLSSQGIIIRDSLVLELLAGLRSVFLDKTGTLTAGHISVAEIVGEDKGVAEILQQSIKAASRSLHPLSVAICREAEKRGIDVRPSDMVRVYAGCGVGYECQRDSVWLGARKWLEQKQVAVPETFKKAERAAATKGQMMCMVAWQGRVRGLFVFGDQAHPEASNVISALTERQLDPMILTGDGSLQAKGFCQRIGAQHWLAEITPQQKQQLLKQAATDDGPVAMVGDGINDAQALVAADVGIAVGHATDLARETADVVLPPNGIGRLPELLDFAKTVKRTILSNLFWAFAYNGLAILLAVLGVLQPVFAAAIMAGSSVFVVTNTIVRLK